MNIALCNACSNGNINEVRSLLRLHDETVINYQDTSGNTCLHYACKSGNENVVLLLLEIGFLPNIQNFYGWTCLDTAIRYNYINITIILLNNGAEINIKNRIDMYNNKGTSGLYLACLYGYTDIVEILLKWDANVNIRGNLGNTCLHVATYNGYKKIVDMLLAKGAYMNILNDCGISVLDCLIYSDIETGILFLEYGANPYKKGLWRLEAKNFKESYNSLKRYLYTYMRINRFSCINSRLCYPYKLYKI